MSSCAAFSYTGARSGSYSTEQKALPAQVRHAAVQKTMCDSIAFWGFRSNPSSSSIYRRAPLTVGCATLQASRYQTYRVLRRPSCSQIVCTLRVQFALAW